MVINSLIKTFYLCVRLALPMLVASAACGPQAPAVLPQAAEHLGLLAGDSTHWLSRYENRQKPLLTVIGLQISIFSFNRGGSHALLTVCDVPTFQAPLWPAVFQEAALVRRSSLTWVT